MKKETKMGLSALLLGAGTLVAGTGILIAAGVGAVGYGVIALIAKHFEKEEEEEEILSGAIEPAQFAVSVDNLSERTIGYLSISALNIEQCDRLIQKISQLWEQGQTFDNLKTAFNKALLQYINSMVKKHEQDPIFLNKYELNHLERALNLIFMHLGFKDKLVQDPQKMIADPQKIKNIEEINSLLFSITEYIMQKSHTIEAQEKNPLKDKPYYGLKHLEFLAQKQKNTAVQSYIQATIKSSYTVTSVNSHSAHRKNSR